MLHTGKKKMHEWFYMVNLEETAHLEDLGIDGI
jgi:hypothetical protein